MLRPEILRHCLLQTDWCAELWLLDVQHGLRRLCPLVHSIKCCHAQSGKHYARNRAGLSYKWGVLTSGNYVRFICYTVQLLTCRAIAGQGALLQLLQGSHPTELQSGDVYVNGRKLDARSYAQVVGTCSQSDAHPGGITVRECLAGIARLSLRRAVPNEQVQ